MRGGYVGNTELQKYADRGDSRARVMVEVVKTEAEDIKDVRTDWALADSTVDFLLPIEGGARLSGAQETHAENTNAVASYLTNLGGKWSTPVDALVVEWAGSEVSEKEIHTLRANLDSDHGGAMEVTHWYAQLFRLSRIEKKDEEYIWTLEERSAKIEVEASAGTNNVDFTFATSGFVPQVGEAPVRGKDRYGDLIEDVPTRPTSVFIVWGLKGTGEAAGNICWNASSDLQVVNSGHTLSRHPLSAASTASQEGQGSQWIDGDRTAGTPVCAVYGKLYSESTISFTSGNLIDLGAAPGGATEMEVVFEASVPSGTVVTPEINDGVGSGWVGLDDGDVIGSGNLASVARQQTYQIRATLTPSTDSLVTPWVHRLGVREISTEDMDQLTQVTGYQQKVDPVTLKSNISEVTISILRDGITDYRDYGSYLLSEYYINELQFRLWYGHPDLNRAYWLHLDDFIIDSDQFAGVGVDLQCINVLSRLRRQIPIIDTGDAEREPLEYDAQTVSAVYDDLLSGQIGVAGRFIGPGLDSTTTPGSYELSKKIKTVRWAKEEVDRVAALGDSAVISSQGRLKAVNFFDSRPPIAYFSYEQVTPRSITSGVNDRITDYFVEYGWDDDKDNGRGAFSDGKFATASDNVMERLGRALIDNEHELDKESCRWIDEGDHALHIAKRFVENFEGGVPVWTVELDSPQPHLEPGDCITIETDRMVMRDPNADRAVRGRLAWRCVVLGVGNIEGTVFALWPQEYFDIIPNGVAISHIGYANPVINGVEVTWADDGTPTLGFRTTECGSVKAVGDDTAFQGKSTVRAQDEETTDSEGYVEVELTGDTYEVGETLYVSALGYEKDDATGSESTYLFKSKVVRPESLPAIIVIPDIDADGNVSATVIGNSLTKSIRILASSRDRTDPTDFPTAVNVRLETAINGTMLTKDDVGTLVTLSDGEAADISAFGYSETSGNGDESDPMTTVPFDPNGADDFVTSAQIKDGNVIAAKLIESSQHFVASVRFLPNARDEVDWQAGDLILSNGTTYSINAGSLTSMADTTLYYVYFDSATSTTVLQTTTTLANATSGKRILLAVCWKGTTATQDAGCVPSVGVPKLDADAINDAAIVTVKLDALAVTAAKIAANAVEADKINANAVTAAKINVATLSAITADCGTLTAGTISTNVLIAANSFTAGTITLNSADDEWNQIRITAAKIAIGRSGFGSNVGEIYMSGDDLHIDAISWLPVGPPSIESDIAITCSGANAEVRIGGGKTRITGDLEVDGDLNHDGSNVGFYGTSPASQATGYTTFSNLSTDRTCDADSTSVAELADILGTLIEDLKSTGIIAA